MDGAVVEEAWDAGAWRTERRGPYEAEFSGVAKPMRRPHRRQVCKACGGRRAVSSVRGRHHGHRSDHHLCGGCWRSALDALRAALLAAGPAWFDLPAT